MRADDDDVAGVAAGDQREDVVAVADRGHRLAVRRQAGGGERALDVAARRLLAGAAGLASRQRRIGEHRDVRHQGRRRQRP
ncbi:MAG TPA: hypothetical protein VHE35_29670, partial [Kofleriaceae bacterium]|nr:hypothetical protein [Kofleriaceae bacterium]